MGMGSAALKGKLREIEFKKIFSFIVLLALLLFFGLVSNRFFSYFNVISILTTVSINGLLAIGMTYAILSGGIDLSVGTVMALCSTMVGYSLVNWNMPVGVAVFIALAAGTCIGFVNGLFIAKVKAPPFIVSLGTMMIASGISILITTARPIHLVSFTNFTGIAQGSLISYLIPGLRLPNSVLIFFVATILAAFVLKKTIFGRYVYAIGSNEESVRLSGVNVDRYKMLVYMTSGFFSGFAGVMMTSRLGSAQPVMGSGYELNAIAAVVLGGTAMKEGMVAGVRELGRTGNITLMGYDHNDAIRAAIRDGSLYGCVMQSPYNMGYEAAKAGLEYITKGVTPPPPWFKDAGVYFMTKDSIDSPEAKLLMREY